MLMPRLLMPASAVSMAEEEEPEAVAESRMGEPQPELRAPLRWRCLRTIIEPGPSVKEAGCWLCLKLGLEEVLDWGRERAICGKEWWWLESSTPCISTSLTLRSSSCEPAASAAEGGVGTSSSSMGEGTSRRSEVDVDEPRFSCGWRRRMCVWMGLVLGRGMGGTMGVGMRLAVLED